MQGMPQCVYDNASDTRSFCQGLICLGKREMSAQKILMVIDKLILKAREDL